MFFVFIASRFITPIKKACIFLLKIQALYCPIVIKRIVPPPPLPSKS